MLELQRKHGGVTPVFLQERSRFVRTKHKKLGRKSLPLPVEGVFAKIGRKLKQLWSGSHRRARHGRAR
jgi:hypothetical protein